MPACTSPDTARYRPNIAIDFDGTIADTNLVKARWIKENLGLDVPAASCDRTSCVPIIGTANYESMAQSVYGDSVTAITPPVPRAVKAIQLLARRATLLVVTNRCEANVRYAERWLAQQGVSRCIDAVISAAGTTKDRICVDSRLDILLDDDIRHRPSAANAHIAFVLFDLHKNRLAPPNVDRVHTWDEFVDLVDRRARSRV